MTHIIWIAYAELLGEFAHTHQPVTSVVGRAPEDMRNGKRKMKAMMNGQPLFPGKQDTSSLDAKQIQQFHQQMINLLSVLSHEFRTPLAIINTAASLLLRNQSPLLEEERGETIQMIQQANRRLSTLTDQLLELAQLEAGLFEVKLGRVDVISVIREVMNHIQQDIAPPNRSSFTFQLQCQNEVGDLTQEVPLILGDALSLRKVFAHLLENAVRFSPKGGTILVMIRPALPEQVESHQETVLPTPAFLEICVCDSGRGIEAQHLERIFEPFYQVETGLTREVSGLGIGLTICSHLIALHGGRIWAESQGVEGSTFRIWLPSSSAPSCAK